MTETDKLGILGKSTECSRGLLCITGGNKTKGQQTSEDRTRFPAAERQLHHNSVIYAQHGSIDKSGFERDFKRAK